VIVDFTGRIDGVEFAGGQASDFGIVIGEGACCRSSRPRSPE
jgi:FKBP-type peptidyl-prolyl cis-trans isomerase (trigger factor)